MKKQFVSDLYGSLYADFEREKRVKIAVDNFTDLYTYYYYRYSSSSSGSLSSGQSCLNSSQFSLRSTLRPYKKINLAKEYGRIASTNVGSSSVQGVTSEINAYFDAPLVSFVSDVDNFDVLSYWRDHMVQFPICARMARDILAIPITSVASESSFSMGGRILTKYRSRLLPKNVEALVTCQNWLSGYSPIEDEGTLDVGDFGDPSDIDFDSIP